MELNPLTCQQVIDLLMDYLEGELPDARRAMLEQHLEGCEACTVYLDGYVKTVSLGKHLLDGPEETVAQMPDELVEAILAARKIPGSS